MLIQAIKLKNLKNIRVNLKTSYENHTLFNLYEMHTIGKSIEVESRLLVKGERRTEWGMVASEYGFLMREIKIFGNETEARVHNFVNKPKIIDIHIKG